MTTALRGDAPGHAGHGADALWHAPPRRHAAAAPSSWACAQKKARNRLRRNECASTEAPPSLTAVYHATRASTTTKITAQIASDRPFPAVIGSSRYAGARAAELRLPGDRRPRRPQSSRHLAPAGLAGGRYRRAGARSPFGPARTRRRRPRRAGRRRLVDTFEVARVGE